MILKSCIIQIEVDSQEAGDNLVKQASSIAFIQFPQDFSKELQQRVLDSSVLSSETSIKPLAYANIDKGSEYTPL